LVEPERSMATKRKADLKEWVVTLAPDTAAATASAALARAGLHVDQVLAEIGVITGRGAASAGAALRRVPGVTDVAEQAVIDIGPPDASVS
jgi:hypothetical protein